VFPGAKKIDTLPQNKDAATRRPGGNCHLMPPINIFPPKKKHFNWHQNND